MIERPEQLNNQAILFANNGNYNDAISCFKRAIVIDSTNYLLWYNLGITYRDMGDLSNAHDSFVKAIKINPENEDAIESLATCCIQMKHLAEAEHYSMIGLDTNEMNPHFWNLMGVINFQRENYKEAAEFFEQALFLNPYYENSLINLRDTYEELGNIKGLQECQKKLDEIK